jgi:hypothetical protein
MKKKREHSRENEEIKPQVNMLVTIDPELKGEVVSNLARGTNCSPTGFR